MLKFSIRDLFWLIIAIGLALGWWLQWRYYKSIWTEDYLRSMENGKLYNQVRDQSETIRRQRDDISRLLESLEECRQAAENQDDG